MKTVRLLVLGLFISLIFNGCKEDGKSSDRKTGPSVKFELPFNNANAQRGQTIRIEVQATEPEAFEEVKVFTKDTVIFQGTLTDTKKLFEVNTSGWKIGTTQISLEAKKKDGKLKRDNRIVKILPNVYPVEYTAEVLKPFPHKTTSYTQGLEFDGDQLYEGTGGTGATGQSMIAKIDFNTGEILQKVELDSEHFGEGITILGDELYQLTWQQHKCFVYDKQTLEKKKEFTYNGEGWGLCNDGEMLIMSDGTERLYFRDPKTFGLKKTIEVYSNKGPVKMLNELEYIEGKIYANVYQSNVIVIIDPETGIVTGEIDVSLVALDYRKMGEVLNGIAYRKSTKQLFITGKNWANLLEIILVK
ncbi:MAG: glutaminyl-peptide cyclotransferase [Brumimicrobium sp.]|nr:glutaminyl-peptide cyclotransferase [Brumimicrobium sp.]